MTPGLQFICPKGASLCVVSNVRVKASAVVERLEKIPHINGELTCGSSEVVRDTRLASFSSVGGVVSLLAQGSLTFSSESKESRLDL